MVATGIAAVPLAHASQLPLEIVKHKNCSRITISFHMATAFTLNINSAQCQKFDFIILWKSKHEQHCSSKLCNTLQFIFTCDSRCILAIAILTVRPSVTQVDQSKTVQARITKSSPSAAWKTLVSGSVNLFHEFERVTLSEGAKWQTVEKYGCVRPVVPSGECKWNAIDT